MNKYSYYHCSILIIFSHREEARLIFWRHLGKKRDVRLKKILVGTKEVESMPSF